MMHLGSVRIVSSATLDSDFDSFIKCARNFKQVICNFSAKVDAGVASIICIQAACQVKA